MLKSTKMSLLSVVLIFAALAGGIYWCWTVRETADSRRAARKEALQALRNAKGDDVRACLDRLAGERLFHTWFDNVFPYMHVAWETRVPADFIAQLAEDAFLKFAGNGEAASEDIAHLRQIMAFIEAFIPTCPANASNGIRERLLDGHFIVGDFDRAIAMLEQGLPGRDPNWCRATVAKLRAHRAMERASKPGLPAAEVTAAKREAMTNFVAFGEYMLTDEMKKFEDCDPTSGVMYSYAWVAAKNFMRSARLAREIGDRAAEADLTARARKYYAPALEKAKEDEKSLEVLKAEMKSFGL